MPRRTQAEQTQQPRAGAQRAAQGGRQRRESRQRGAQPHPSRGSATRGRTSRRSRARAQGAMLTVAIRGPFADRMRALAESTGMSLAKLLKDALLVYQERIEAGYEPGTSLRTWQEREGEQEESAA